MKFSLACSVSLGRFFGGSQITSPLKGQLSVAADYSLMYIFLGGAKDAENAFDIIKSLNEAFHLKLNFQLKVKSSGFFQVAARSEQSIDLQRLRSGFPEIPFPEGIDHIRSLKDSATCFWAAIEFSKWEVGSSLLQIGGETPRDNSLRIYGFFTGSQELKPESVYSAELPRFELFGLFAFEQLTFEYRFSNATEYKISGRIGVRNFINENEFYYFRGAIEKKGPNVLGVVAAEGPISLLLPFEMPGITFSDLKFAVWSSQDDAAKRERENLFWLEGKVNYGESLNLAGQIYLDGKTPRFVKIELLSPLSIGKIFQESIPGYEWPAEYVDILFKPGSCIYYFNETQKKLSKPKLYSIDRNNQIVAYPDNNTYQPGFNIYAKVDLTFFETISFAGNFNITSKGVIASIQFDNPIDIYVLQLHGLKDPTKGPLFEVSSVEPGKYLRLTSSISFFGADFSVNTLITVSKDQTDPNRSTLIEGTLSTNERYVVFNGNAVSLSFLYSKYRGFKVTGWPQFDLAQNIIDFLKELEKLTSTGGLCAAVVNLVGKSYETVYQLTPSFRTETSGLYLDLTGSFRLSIAGQELALLKAPPFSLEVPKKITINELPGAIATAIGKAAAGFLKSLMDNPQALATFLTIVAAEQAVKIAAKLACETLVKAALQAAVDAGLAAAGAAGATVATVAAAIAKIFSGGGGSDSSSGGGGSDSGSGGGDGGKKDEDKGDGGKSDDSSSKPGENPKPPGNFKLIYEYQTVVASWDGMSNAAGYKITFYDDAGYELYTETMNNEKRKTTLLLNSEAPVRKVIGKVVSIRGDFKSAESVATIERCATPGSIQLTLQRTTKKLSVSWTSDAQTFEIRLLQNGQVISFSDAKKSPVELDRTELAPGSYSVMMAAFAGNTKIPSLLSQPSNVVWFLSAPGAPDVSFVRATSAIAITWQAVNNAAGYRVKLLDISNVLAVPEISVPANQLTASVAVTALKPGAGEYHAQIVAVADETSVDSPVAHTPTPVGRLGDIEELRFILKKETLELAVSWKALAGSAGYEAMLYEAGTAAPVTTTINSNMPGAVMSLTPFLKKEGATWSVKARSAGSPRLITGNLVAAPGTIRQIAAPALLTMNWNIATAEMNVGWKAVDDAVQYLVQVSNEKQEVVFSRTVDKSVVLLTIKENEFTALPDGKYKLAMKAIADARALDSVLVDGPLIEVTHLVTPVIMPLVLDYGIIKVSLAKAAVYAEKYDAQLVIDDKPSGALTPMTAPSRYQDNWQISITPDENIPGRKYQVRVRAVMRGGTQGDWVISGIINRLAPPVPGPLNLDANIIKVSLAGAAEAQTHYSAQLISEGKPFGQAVGMNPSGIPSVRILADGLAGRVVQARIMASREGYLSSPWAVTDDYVIYAPEMIFAGKNELLLWRVQPIGRSVVATSYRNNPPYLDAGVDEPWHGRYLKIIPVDPANLKAGYLLADNEWYVSPQTITRRQRGGPSLLMTNKRNEAVIFLPYKNRYNALQLLQHPSQGNNALTLRTDGTRMILEPRMDGDAHPRIQFHSFDLRNTLELPDLAPLTVAWERSVLLKLKTLTPGASGYEVQLIVDGATVGDIVPMKPATQGGSDYSIDFKVNTGTSVQIKCRAVQSSGNPSGWVTSTTVSRLPTPALLPLQFAGNRLTVTLANRIEGADSYRFILGVDGQMAEGVDIAQPAVPGAPVTAQFDIDKHGMNAAFNAYVQATGKNFLISDMATSTDRVTRPTLEKVDWKKPGDQLLTFDRKSGLYWLNWTVATNLSRDQMNAELAANYPGFRYASINEVRALTVSAGAPNPGERTTGNVEPIKKLLGLIGTNDYFQPHIPRGNSSCAHIDFYGRFAVLTIETGDNPVRAKAGELGGCNTQMALFGHALVTSVKPKI